MQRGPDLRELTRLALQLARDVLDAFGDGAWCVPLAPVGVTWLAAT